MFKIYFLTNILGFMPWDISILWRYDFYWGHFLEVQFQMDRLVPFEKLEADYYAGEIWNQERYDSDDDIR